MESEHWSVSPGIVCSDWQLQFSGVSSRDSSSAPEDTGGTDLGIFCSPTPLHKQQVSSYTSIHMAQIQKKEQQRTTVKPFSMKVGAELEKIRWASLPLFIPHEQPAGITPGPPPAHTCHTPPPPQLFVLSHSFTARQTELKERSLKSHCKVGVATS